MYWLSIVMLYITAAATGEKHCQLVVENRNFAPMFCTTYGMAKEPDGYIINGSIRSFHRYAIGDEVMLSCNLHNFEKFESSYITATCKGNNVLDVNGSDKIFSTDLSCGLRPIRQIPSPVTGCNSKYTSIEFGFRNDEDQQTNILGEVCVDEELGKTIFVHIKSKANLTKTELSDVSLGIRDYKFLDEIFYMDAYKKDFRIAYYSSYGYRQMSKHLRESLKRNYLIKRNVLRNLKIYKALDFTWNYIMFNGNDTVANLESLESDILKIKADKSLDLFYGSNGVLTEFGENGETKIFMYVRRFPVPKYIWIGVRSETKFVGFVVVNSPTDETDTVFSSKCDHIRWLKLARTRNLIENRKIVCCEYESFKNNIPEMPQLTGKFELFV